MDQPPPELNYCRWGYRPAVFLRVTILSDIAIGIQLVYLLSSYNLRSGERHDLVTIVRDDFLDLGPSTVNEVHEQGEQGIGVFVLKATQ